MDMGQSISGRSVVFWRARASVVARTESSKVVGDQGFGQDVVLQLEDRTCRTYTIAKGINVSAGDELSLVSMSEVGSRNWHLVGIVNHSSGRYMAMPQGVLPIKPVPSGFARFINGILSLYGVPGAILVVLGTLWLGLQTMTTVRLSILEWLGSFLIGMAMLACLKELVTWSEEIAEKRFVRATEKILKSALGEDKEASKGSRTKDADGFIMDVDFTEVDDTYTPSMVLRRDWGASRPAAISRR